MIDILPRVSMYSNEMMWKQCEILKSVVTQTKEVKTGRGRNVEIYQVPKHNTEKSVVERIIRSCEYYKSLYEMESKGSVKFRDYQVDIIEKGTEILLKNKFLYLAMEVRTGKTLTSLGIAERVDAKNVLFITKKRAPFRAPSKFLVKFLIRNQSYMRFVTFTLRYQALVFASSEASVLTVSPAATAPAPANGLAARP